MPTPYDLALSAARAELSTLDARRLTITTAIHALESLAGAPTPPAVVESPPTTPPVQPVTDTAPPQSPAPTLTPAQSRCRASLDELGLDSRGTIPDRAAHEWTTADLKALSAAIAARRAELAKAAAPTSVDGEGF